MKTLVLALSVLCVEPLFAARTPAFTMRFDDNRDPRAWKSVCTSFDSRGLVCSLAVNCADLNDAQWQCLKELSAKGHEVMDHTPSHALYGMRIADSNAFARAKGLPFVASVDEKRQYVRFQPVVDPAHPKNVRRRLTVRDGVVDMPDGKPHLGRYVNMLIPGRKDIVALSLKDGVYRFFSFWEQPLTEKMTLDDVEVTLLSEDAISPTADQLRLMAKTSADAFSHAGLPAPKTWIRPGGWYPRIAWDALKRVYGDEFGYVCGDVWVPVPRRLSVTDNDTVMGKWTMCYDGYFFDQGPQITPEMVADHIQACLADGRSIVILSHLAFWSLPGGLPEMLEKIDRLAQILAERKVPMCTYSALAVRTFGE